MESVEQIVSTIVPSVWLLIQFPSLGIAITKMVQGHALNSLLLITTHQMRASHLKYN